jgi:hypothetical protein
MKQAKVDLLDHLWSQTYRHFAIEGRKTKDKAMMALALAIAKINKDCKDWLLRKYIERCTEKHALAFFQWRARERRQQASLSELQETMGSLQRKVLGSIDLSRSVSAKTVTEAKVPAGLARRLKLDKPEYQPYFVNTFGGLAWPDPFPDKTSSVEPELLHDRQDLVYPPSRYRNEASPAMLFLPSKQMILKMMRACMGVTRIQDLWLY